ncbi:helix-turn-helix transcriptional regulator [Alkalibacter saccharofermentans]|uniref:Putative transcriptional regulator n=1 Tax=Alkalibacter saccharofermentans DSM 14828 TaxID=1120975 RepID=A0A1M4ZJV5_9FIRM|nr:helix-turn-helix transcriptional regulator [Alkalibacter saccharofermentans]SHF17836.1 putative transcriptional regulator [Alkalibacter saccharofermentans DSM 14828]
MGKYTIKAKRVERGIKQMDLSQSIGISQQYLSKIEKNAANPSRDLMIKIAKELDADIKDLFFNETE